MRSVKRLARWLGDAGIGLMRSVVLAVAALFVPAIALIPAFVDWLWGSPWSWTNPWSWVGLVLTLCVLALVFAKPAGRLFRRVAARWSGIQIDDGYRRPGPKPVRMATGYWWNGHSYERSRRDAELDQRWRSWLTDPAYWRDVRWLGIAAVTVAPVCSVPPAALDGAAAAVAAAGAAAGVVASEPGAVSIGDGPSTGCMSASRFSSTADEEPTTASTMGAGVGGPGSAARSTGAADASDIVFCGWRNRKPG